MSKPRYGARIQCKNIPVLPILAFLMRLQKREIVSEEAVSPVWPSGKLWTPIAGTTFTGYANSVQNAMPPGTPERLAVAKMKGLIKFGLVSGCTCGCRGDFELTDKGIEMLAQASEVAQ